MNTTATRESEAKAWRDAATRSRLKGQMATAVTFDNMAWLVEHGESWLAHPVKSGGEQVTEYVKSNMEILK